MPYGYGSANRRGPSGPGPGGQGARGQATQNPGRGGGWSPGVGGRQHQPKTKTVTTGGQSPFAYTKPPKKKIITGGGGPPSVLNPPTKKTTPVTTGGASPFTYTKTPKKKKVTTHPFAKNEKTKKAFLAKSRKVPGYLDFAQSLVNPWETTTWAGTEDDPANMTLGSRGIMRGLKDYMFGKGITDLQNLPADAKVWMAHGPKPSDLANLKKTGFKSTRPGGKGSLLISPRSWEQALKGKNPLEAKGVYTAVGKTKEEALKAAGRFGKPWYSRGAGAPVDASKVLVGQVARGTHPIHSGVTRVAQMEVPSHVANKAFQIGDKGARVGAIPAKGMIKSTVGRMLPGVGAALGGASALKHYQEGNYGQAAMAGLSMAPGPLGWLGLAGEMGLGALQKWRQNQANGGLINLYKYGGFLG